MYRREWANFLKMNDSSEISSSLLWETGKAVMRGKIISYSSYKKKQQHILENNLEQQIKSLTEEYTTNPNEQTGNKLNHLKNQLETIIHRKTEFIIQQLKHEKFQFSNKSGKYLANLLQFKKERAFIPSLLNSSGDITQSPQEINNIFLQYYSKLYSSNHNPSQSELDDFLNTLELPSLTEEQVKFLDSPISIQELNKTFHNMQNNKSPGPDGFPAEFYKHFWDILSPLFYKVTIEIKSDSTIPIHMKYGSYDTFTQTLFFFF